MRTSMLATAAILPLASPLAAAPIGHPGPGLAAATPVDQAEPVACWGYGWRGYGWYSELNVACWGPPLVGAPYVDPPLYAAPGQGPARIYRTTPPFDDVRRCWFPDDGPNGGRWRVC